MILKFTGSGKVLLDYLRTLPGVVEEHREGLVCIDIANLPKKYAGLREHIDTIVPPYHVWHDLDKVYEVSIPEFAVLATDLSNVKIVKVIPDGSNESAKLIEYLGLLTEKSATVDENGKLKFRANVQDKIVRTFVVFLERQGCEVEWSVPLVN